MKLVSQRGFIVTPDTAEALRKLEVSAAQVPGLKLKVSGVPSYLGTWAGVSEAPGPTGLPAEISMRPTGREVYLSAEVGGISTGLEVIWGLAIPLGFMPWNRYPVPSPLQEVFHYLGPWGSLVDLLHGDGRGELAWSSLCAAAQTDVGRWEGGRQVERAVQAQLHRLGIHCGPVDGVIGEKTLAAVQSLGFRGKPLQEILAEISKWEPPTPAKENLNHGTFAMPGKRVTGFSSGGVRLVKTSTGFSVSADAPGKATFVVGD